MAAHLFKSLALGALELTNRIVMAPMTRNRAEPDGSPNELMARHYARRATAGLIVAEGSWPTVTGQAYCRQPGIETSAQIAGWRRVTDAVHSEGGLIVLQLMHAGRIGSRHIKPIGVETIGPSVLQARGQIWTDSAGMQPHDVPREMRADDVRTAVQQHRQACRVLRGVVG